MQSHATRSASHLYEGGKRRIDPSIWIVYIHVTELQLGVNIHILSVTRYPYWGEPERAPHQCDCQSRAQTIFHMQREKIVWSTTYSIFVPCGKLLMQRLKKMYYVTSHSSLIPRSPFFIPSCCIHNSTCFFFHQPSALVHYCEIKRKVKMGEGWERDQYQYMTEMKSFEVGRQALIDYANIILRWPI